MDRSKMADGLRCAEFKGAGLESEVLGWLGYAVRRWAQRCVIGWDRRRWPRRRCQKTAAVRKILAREALTRKAQTFAQTFVREQVSEYGRRP